jgi:hypothetical protein
MSGSGQNAAIPTIQDSFVYPSVKVDSRSVATVQLTSRSAKGVYPGADELDAAEHHGVVGRRAGVVAATGDRSTIMAFSSLEKPFPQCGGSEEVVDER